MFDTFAMTAQALTHLVQGFSEWSPAPLAFYWLCLLSALSAWMMARFLAAPPLVTIPAGSLLLFSLGLIANYLGKDTFIDGATEAQRLVIFTMLAHGFGAMILFIAFKSGEVRRQG